jgi:hypothetical protein
LQRGPSVLGNEAFATDAQAFLPTRKPDKRGGAAPSAAATCGGTSGRIGESREGGHNVVVGAEGEA